MPTSPEIDRKLTPAARQALDELVNDYRSQLLVGAADEASRLGDLREISVRDIMSSLSRQQSRLFGPARSSVERLLRLYVLAGLLLGGVGFVAFTARELVSARSLVEQLPLVLSVAGFALAAVGYMLLSIRKQRLEGVDLEPSLESLSPYPSSFLSLWRDIELALRSVAAVRLGESAASGPISLLLERLQAERILTNEDQNIVRRLLSLRNAVAHGHPGKTDKSEIKAAQHDAIELLKRLRSLS